MLVPIFYYLFKETEGSNLPQHLDDVFAGGVAPMETETVQYRTSVTVVAFNHSGLLSVCHILIGQHSREQFGHLRVLTGNNNRLG